MKPMKTPGVYIVEKNAFPNSVVQVATAVPAFIGYTETAANGNKSLRNTPWRISSMAEFHSYFGGGPTAMFDLVDAQTSDNTMLDSTDQKDPLLPAVLSVNGKEKELQQKSNPYALYGAMRLFFQNGGGPCYVVSIGGYSDDIDADKMLSGIKLLEKESEPTMVVIPETTRLVRANAVKVQQQMLMHCGERMKNRFAILDIFGGHLDRQSPVGDPVATFRNDVGINFLDYGAAYYPWVNTAIYQARDFTFENFTAEGRDALIDVLKESLDPSGAGGPQFEIPFAEIDWIKDGAIENAAAGEAPTPENVDKTLRAIVPLYTQVMNELAARTNCMPPAAAMAGIYTMVDATRGVWKAPANVSLNSVTSPTVNISHDDQEDLNVTPQGKSINAIRPFVGEGVLVWGARTLDGNSLDWRYVNVRRTMIMLEESIRLASKAYVFEPNTASTWVTIRSMIENFLTGIWKQGGLAGAVPGDAFSVHVGLGETMTPVDILEGILRVTVLVAISRPAEFIEITFQQQMQKS
ncbi:MAG: phage tail sheath C-terminal domain-containing protein [Pseudomonadota bacterium]